MQLTANTEVIIGRLGKMSRIIPKKIILPITECLLFRINRNKMFVAANNGFIQVSTELMIDSNDEFSFCVPYDIFFNTIKNIGEPAVSISLDESKPFSITIKAKKKKYSIGGVDPASFGLLSTPTKESYITADSQTIREVMQIAGKFVNPKAQIEALKGVFMSVIGDMMVLNSTDSFSLARMTFRPDSIHNWNGIIIPFELGIIMTELLLTSEILTVATDSRKLHIESKDFNIISVLLEYKYPDCEVFFLNIAGQDVVVNKRELDHALSILKLYTNEETNVLIFDVNGERLLLSADNNSRNNSGMQQIDLTPDSGRVSMRTGFNIDFFIKSLSSITASSVILKVSADPKKPTYIEPMVDVEPVIESKFLLMPISLQ